MSRNVHPVTALKDAQEFGRRVAAARSYAGMKRPAFAKVMGRSVPTITRWEDGAKGSIGASIEQRRQLAQRIVEVTGCPPEWFDLSEPEPGEVDRLRDEMDEMKTELLEEIERVRAAQASAQRSPKPAEEDPRSHDN